ncbi:DUF2079 domain-containing protein [Sphingomonas japonica]|uniref:DUF2029 domain-containing protein n=1 Tax=Sphingomonas japonica TaxID=511662 RepID=A0ABX0U331_9SPHN|nr:DUF2079 domain-containing protein [Sphingomonas japonica]NIJ24980.1 hypothetical protein [Sphingomonas japonica]
MIDLPPPPPRGDAPLWLARPTRFARLSPRTALAAVFVVAMLLAIAVATADIDMTASASVGAGDMTDLILYQTIIEGVRVGDNYYPVAVDALRAGSFPLRPFLTFRLPTLAVMLATLSPVIVPLLQWALAAAVAGAWLWRLRPALPRPPARIVAAILIAGGMVVFVDSDLAAFHELWAAMLVALSLALRRQDRWIEAVAFALMAMLVRETAALFVVIMGALAWLEGARREAAGWGAALAVFAIVIGFHAAAVGAVTSPLDAASPGWSGLHGFGLFVRSVTLATALQALPLALAAMLVALALLGWAAWDDPIALRALATFSGYAALIGVFGRIDTFYWGLMVAPILLVGLVFVPDAARDLARRALDRRRVRVVRTPG